MKLIFDNNGIQGKGSSKTRAMIPQEFCIELVQAVEKGGNPSYQDRLL